jgi:hypothetical protein
MKPRTMPASNGKLFLMAANQGQSPNAGFPAVSRDVRSREIDQAMEEKASPLMVVRLNSYVLDIYKNAFMFAPAFGYLLDTAAKSFALCMEWQVNCLTLMASRAKEGYGTLLNVAAPSSTVAGSSRGQAQPTAEELAHSMDIAIGERFIAPSSTVTSISGGQAQPTEEVPESSMEIAIAARAA